MDKKAKEFRFQPIDERVEIDEATRLLVQTTAAVQRTHTADSAKQSKTIMRQMFKIRRDGIDALLDLIEQYIEQMPDDVPDETHDVFGLYQCPECQGYYGLDATAVEIINQCLTNETGLSKGVVICDCGARSVFGGERDSVYQWDGIMMFGDTYSEEYSDLPTVKAVRLVEASEDDPEEVVVASTYEGYHPHFGGNVSEGRTIRLKRG